MKFSIVSTFILLSLFSIRGMAGEEMANMPKIQPKDTYTIKSQAQGEDLLDNRGFGDKEPMVRMMNLMMVEGSGMTGMDMKMAANHEEPTHFSERVTSKYTYEFSTKPSLPKIGVNIVTIFIHDSKKEKVVKGLKLKVQVYSKTMDMGTSEPRVREIAPGKYQLKVNFTMEGTWALKLILPNEEKVLDFNVQSK